MAETLLLVPAVEAGPLVDGFRASHDPSAAAGVPAHITVLYPFRHPDLIDADVLADLHELFAVHSPFSYVFSATGRFPTVTYLSPDPSETFVALTRAVAVRFPECPPYWGLYEDVIPHCTVVHAEDEALHRSVADALAPSLPVHARASEVVLMEEREGRWTFRERFALGAR